MPSFPLETLVMNVSKAILKDNILITFDDKNQPVDILDLSQTLVGSVREATVEKVLKDIEGCILKLDDGITKAFIENKYLKPEFFVYRHSLKKQVCQADRFYVCITQDRKDTKPCSCRFVAVCEDKASSINYFLKELLNSDIVPANDETGVFHFPSIMEKAMKTKVYLKNDADIVIERTTALNSIDVNTGKGLKKKDFFTTNSLAAVEIARQIRLKRLSGIIIVDFLKDMSKEEQKGLIKLLKDECASDYCRVDIHGFTSLGLLEMTRERIYEPLI